MKLWYSSTCCTVKNDDDATRKCTIFNCFIELKLNSLSASYQQTSVLSYVLVNEYLIKKVVLALSLWNITEE